MTSKDEKPSWKRFQKLRFSQKAFSRHARKFEKNTIRHARRFVSSRLDRLSAIKRTVLGWVVLALVLAGVSATQWVAFRGSYTETVFGAGGTYSEGVLGPLETLNPIFARTSAEKSAARLLFASLYHYDETGHIKGDLAESITVNDTETEYTVRLLSGLTWSDGAALTAADVVFTVDLLKNRETRSEISGWGSFRAEVVDARTIKFTLPGSYAPFVHTLTFPVLPKHTLGEVKPSELREQAFSQSPVTSGPFALRMLQTVGANTSKKVAHLVANPRYHAGAPRLERFQLYVYASREDIKQGLRTNEISATPELSYAELPDGVKRSYESSAYATNNGVYAFFNTTQSVLNSSRVRQALTLSVNTDELREQLSRSTSPLYGPVLQDQVEGALPNMPVRDIEKAKTLLDEDGWIVSDGVRKKEGQPLTLRLIALKGADFNQTTEELAKVWRKELHIKVDTVIMDPLDPSQSVIQTVLQPRDFDVLVYRLALGGDPDVYAYWHSSQATSDGLNFSNYSNIVADDALSGGRSRAAGKYRADRYAAFVKRWIADAPAMPLYQTKLDYIQSRSVSSIAEGSKFVGAEDRYANVIYWSAERTSVYKTP